MSEEKSSVREVSREAEMGQCRDRRIVLIAFLTSVIVVIVAEALGAWCCHRNCEPHTLCPKRKCGRSFGWKECSIATEETALCRQHLRLAEQHLALVREAHAEGRASVAQLTDAALERDLCLLKLWRYEAGLPPESGAVDAALKVAAARTKLLAAGAGTEQKAEKHGLLEELRHQYEAARAEFRHWGDKIKAIHLWNHGAAALDDYPQNWDPDAMLMLFRAEYFPGEIGEIMVLTPVDPENPAPASTPQNTPKTSKAEKGEKTETPAAPAASAVPGKTVSAKK